ncbi:COMM domain-containing protein 2-like isoform X1 [Pecten maximus]|uniref:COMM domain-containing protein 2-like isoform X1 n=2 Tax=Pecten maximus TaxID=6579 RepID=UPI001458EC2D|nr:COMM domain-containing protein 2-like isoform X1 [Pecten maximus]
MLLIFDDNHKEHLSFLTDTEIDVVREFCKISMEFIRKGSNRKIYQGAAQKLKVDAETIQHGVEGLMYLLTESSKLMLNEIDFQDSILTLGFSDDMRQTLLELYLQNRREIRAIMSEMSMELPHYQNLEWRFDVQLASRSLRRQTTPLVTFKLHIEDDGERETKVLQTDPVNLVHLTKVLDEALQEMKSPYCRRIVRNIK